MKENDMDIKKAISAAISVKSAAGSIEDCIRFTEAIPDALERLEIALKELKQALKGKD